MTQTHITYPPHYPTEQQIKDAIVKEKGITLDYGYYISIKAVSAIWDITDNWIITILFETTNR